MQLGPGPPPPPPPGAPPPPPAAPPPPPAAPGRSRAGWFIGLAALVIAAVVVTVVVVSRQPRFPRNASGAGPTAAAKPHDQASALADAYAQHRIDTNTWIRYRAYSLFGVSALPSEFRSGAQSQDDDALAPEWLDPSEPRDLHDALTPLLSRPTDPASAYYGGGVVKTSSRQGAVTLMADTTCGPGASPTSWVGRDSIQHAGLFKVWTRCGGDWNGRLNVVMSTYDTFWNGMTTQFALPLPDVDPKAADATAYGGDGALDVYLVPRDVPTTRLGAGTVTLGGFEAGGLAMPTAPFTGNRSSGYILLDEGRTTDAGYIGTMVHEFFHIMEYALNQKATHDKVGDHWESNWFTEASSTWAATHYARNDVFATFYANAGAILGETSPVSVDAHGPTGSDNFDHTYNEFIWLYFMEQDAGINAVADAWRGSAMAAARNGAEGTAAFDEAFPFEKHIADFAARSINDGALRGVLGHVFGDQNPAFPNQVHKITYTIPVSALDASATPAVQAGISALPDLSSQYYRVHTDPSVKQMTWSISGQNGAAHMHAELILSSPTPKRIPLPIGDTRVCDLNAATDGYLVVSNGATSGDLGMNFSVRGSSDSCTPQTPSSITFRGITPSTLEANDQTTTVEVSGSGFAGLDPKSIQLGGGRNGDILTLHFLSGGGLEQVTVVSDTAIDIRLAISSDNSAGVWDLQLSGIPTSGGPALIADCKGCLTITPKPG